MNTSNIIIRAIEQCGLSPKVKVPSVVLAALGVGCLIAGLVLEDDTFMEVGLALIGASGITLGAGYSASPGSVVVSGQETHATGDLYRREQEESYPSAGEAGYSVVEALLVVFLALVILIVLLRLV